MALPKAVYDPSKPTKNLVTTISGIVTLLITILVGLGVIKPELQSQIQDYANILISSGSAIWGVIAGLILIFKAKD